MNVLRLLILTLLVLLVGSSAAQKEKRQKPATIDIMTSALCGDCEDRIEGDLNYFKGVKRAVLNLETKVLTVKYDPNKTNPDAIRQRISSLGYAADDVPANKEAFDKLPGCCQKEGACSGK